MMSSDQQHRSYHQPLQLLLLTLALFTPSTTARCSRDSTAVQACPTNQTCKPTPHQFHNAYTSASANSDRMYTACYLDLVRIDASVENISGLSVEEYVGFPRDRAIYEHKDSSCEAKGRCAQRRTIYDLNQERGGEFFPRFISIPVCLGCREPLNLPEAGNPASFPVERMECLPQDANVTCLVMNVNEEVLVCERSPDGTWQHKTLSVNFGCSCTL